MSDQTTPANNWGIAILGGFTVFLAVALPSMCMPVLFDQIAKDLGLSLAQIGTIWGISGLAAIFSSSIGGQLGDRFGPKKTISTACFLVGVLGALRGLSADFLQLAVTMFCFGLVMNATIVNVHKSAGIFYADRRLVIANGIVSAGVALGMLTGALISDSIMSPLLGGWQRVLFLYGAISATIGCIWFFMPGVLSTPARTGSKSSPPLGRTMLKVLRVKNVWLLGMAHFCYMGALLGLMGYLPLYLRGLEWAPAVADGALAGLNAAGLLGALPFTMLAGRLGLRNGIAIPALVVSLICMSLIPFFQVRMVWMVWLAVFLIGFMRDGYIALIMTMATELPKIGVAYAGTAMGLLFSFGNLGTFVTSPMGYKIAEVNRAYAFFFWAALLAVGILILRFVRLEKKEVVPEPSTASLIKG